MKKVYLSLFLTGVTFGGVFAQNNSAPHKLKPATRVSDVDVKPTPVGQEKAVYWSEDFANGFAGNSSSAIPAWTFGATNGDVWRHSYDPSNGEWSTGTDPMLSTTAANGYMLFDADSVNFPLSPNYINLTGELISPVIDLSSQTSVLLTFEQDFRYCCSGSHDVSVSVSTDGGGTWGTPHAVLNGTQTNDDFYTTNGDSYLMALNLTNEAGSQANVKLKFTWDGNNSGSSHYYWSIDDVSLADLPAHDLVAYSSWIAGENNDGIEYGRTPENQTDANWLVGTEVYNFGANIETNVTLDADFGAFTSQTVETPFAVDTTIYMESTEALTLTPALYTGAYTVTSDDETSASPLFGNNSGAREFEITPASTNPGSIYSQDGIGVYASPNLTSIGTNSFTDGEDGLVLATMYHIKNSAEVDGIRVMLANGTVPGGEVYGSIKDTSLFWANDMSPLFATQSAIVTAADINAGYIDVAFSSAITLTPGAYYAAVELFSNGNANDIVVVDDQTVPQPFDASAIYIAGDQSWSNGTALAIRMLMGDTWLSVDGPELTGVSIYPNPSEGIVNVSNDGQVAHVIEVFNMAGQVVLTKEASSATTIDLSAFDSGVYMVQVSNEAGTIMERVVLK